jgi:hypothetical protein
MRADVCDPLNPALIAGFKAVLTLLGAELLEHHSSSLQVELWHYRVGKVVLKVFADPWRMDIEGPPALVKRVMAAFQKRQP